MPILAQWARRISPRRAETLDKGHGRLEQRRLWASTALNEYVNFPHVAQVCRIERETVELKSGKQRSETVFTITSLAPEQADPHQLLQLNRGQWAIENRSHYVRDMAFDEDRSRIRVGTGAAMMACLRNFAIALARLNGFTNIAAALRAFANQPRRALAAVGV
jgi:predicted transposase YbfD/YdcC